MTLLTSAIMSACMGISTGQYNTACDKALEAEMKQTGVEQQESSGEKKTMDWGTKVAKDNLGETGAAVVAATVFTAKSYTEKKLSFPIKDTGICNTLSPEIKKDSAALNFIWKW